MKDEITNGIRMICIGVIFGTIQIFIGILWNIFIDKNILCLGDYLVLFSPCGFCLGLFFGYLFFFKFKRIGGNEQ